eukprot:1196113-Prorocentrum_minimum.AAC.16
MHFHLHVVELVHYIAPPRCVASWWASPASLLWSICPACNAPSLSCISRRSPMSAALMAGGAPATVCDCCTGAAPAISAADMGLLREMHERLGALQAGQMDHRRESGKAHQEATQRHRGGAI